MVDSLLNAEILAKRGWRKFELWKRLITSIHQLGTLLGALPDGGGTYYLHDIALLPAARGQGAAAMALNRINSAFTASVIEGLQMVSKCDKKCR